MSKRIPWSGWGWPTASYPPPMARDDGPLDKFDEYIKKITIQNPNTVEWELAHHYHPGCRWCGHCHGWAAAAILEPEPTMSTVRYEITFTVGDLKGLLTEVHCTDSLDLWKGWRDVMPPYEEDKLEAVEFHWVMLNWVGNGEPVVMDIEKAPEVWNHPVFKCKMTSHPDRFDSTKTQITCEVWVVSGNVSPDYVGTKAFQRVYRYWIKGDFNNPSEGDWTNKDRPGFIWHPDYVDTTAAGANPVVNYYHSYVKELAKCRRLIVFAVPDMASVFPVGGKILDMGPDNPVTSLIFRGLVSLHGVEGYAVPAIADSWVSFEDGLTHEFHLKGVTFHDGTPLTARDVAFTYNAIMNPDFRSPYRDTVREIIDGVDVVNEDTVVFRLTHKMTDFPALHGWYWILPHHVEDIGIDAFSHHPVGSGPFTFESLESGRLTLAAFTNYYCGKPTLDQIIFTEVIDETQRLDLLSEGRADVALFDYTEEMERKARKLQHVKTVAIPPGAPRRLEIQSVRVQGRIPNQFDGAWNVLNWGIDLVAPEPVAPIEPRRPVSRRVRGIPTHTKSPEWRKGVWWRIQVQQRAIASGISDPGWTLPFNIVFEIVGEETIDDTPCYCVRVTYPDRPRSAEYKYADIWISKDGRVPVKGVLHIGKKNIPMRYDFLMRLLETTPMEVEAVEASGIPTDSPRAEKKKRKRDVEAFEIRTSTGGKCLLSPAAPFPLQIEEPMYIVKLQDWGD